MIINDLSSDAGLTGLVFFFVVFIVIAIWVLSPSRKNKLEEHKFIPLQENQDDK